MPPDQYAQAAQEALAKLSPEERAEFLKMLQERAAARGVKLPGNVAADPKDLGKVLTDLHEKPGQLRDIGDCYPPRWPSGRRRASGNPWKRLQVCRIVMISTMRTARPTTGSPLSVFEAGTAPFDPMSSRFALLANSIQHIHSLRASGVMSSHVSNAFALETSAFFRSAGRSWTTPAEICFSLIRVSPEY